MPGIVSIHVIFKKYLLSNESFMYKVRLETFKLTCLKVGKSQWITSVVDCIVDVAFQKC